MDIFTIIRQELNHKTNVTKKARRALTVAMFSCSLMLIMQIVTGSFMPTFDDEILSILTDIGSYIIYLGIPFGFAQIIFTKLFKNDKEHIVRRIVPQKPILFIAGVLGIGYLVNMIVNAAFGWLLDDFTVDFTGEIHHTPLGIVLKYVFMALCPAILEEWAFRGVLLRHLRRYSRFGALIVSSVLFGLMHIDLPRIIFASIFGFLLGICFDYTGSIKIPILIHFLNNAISVTVSIVAPNNLISSICSIVILSLIGCGIGAIIYYGRNGLSEKKLSLNKPSLCGYTLELQDFIKTAVLNVGFLIMILIFGMFFCLLYFV